MTRSLIRVLPLVAAFGLIVSWTSQPAQSGAQQPSQGQKLANAAEHNAMELLGTDDLQARSAYQPWVQRYGNGRYILFVGHHTLGTNPVTGAPLPSFNPLTGVNEENGVSIVDVSNPRRPVYLFHLPVSNGTGGGAQMVRVCGGSTLPIGNNKVYLLRAYADSAHEIWDVTNPSSPQPVRTVSGGNPVIGSLAGTHKSYWECDTGIAYIVGRRSTDTAAGWRPGNHIMIFNLSNPATPVFIRDWALHGQEPGAPLPPNFTAVPSIHGPISLGPTGNRVYFAYGTSSNGVMQIVNRNTLLTGPADYTTAEIGRLVMQPAWGAHTSFPVLNLPIADWAPNAGGAVRDFVVVTSEAGGAFCQQQIRHVTFMVDVTAQRTAQDPSRESRPQSVATFQVPASSGDFCERGGRFGPHATNEEFGSPFYGKIVFISYFNAGVLAVDIRDPYNPQEVAFFIPATTANTDFRCGTLNGVPNTCRQVIQTNNVATDDRGYIYIVDRANTGLHVLQLSGAAKKIIE